MIYKEVTFHITPYSEDIADALIYDMGSIGYDGFCNTDDGFIAYIPAPDFKETAISEMELLRFFSVNHHFTWTCSEIAEQNWNKTWEDNFTPILVKDRILVRAGFHPTISHIEYEIIIEPKMSFGSGHHATTAMMLETILDFTDRIKEKRILDMGCGTGILSIMASKAGAAHITGIDIDEWAYNNALENIRANHIRNISVKIGDAGLLESEENFDFILANINRNILLNDMHHYVARLASKGWLMMSGFYSEDLPLIRKEADKQGLSYHNHKINDNWIAATFYKN